MNTENLFNIAGSILIVSTGTAVLAKYVVPHISPRFIEIGCYFIGASLTSNKYWIYNITNISTSSSLMLSIPGQLILPATLLYTLDNNNINANDYKKSLLLLGSTLWGTYAIIYDSQFLGTLNMISLLLLSTDCIKPIITLFEYNFNLETITAYNYSIHSYLILYILSYVYIFPSYLLPFQFSIYGLGLNSLFITSLILSDRDATSTKYEYVFNNTITCLSLFNLYYISEYIFPMPIIIDITTIYGYLYTIQKWYDVKWSDPTLATFVLGLGMMFLPITIKTPIMNSIERIMF